MHSVIEDLDITRIDINPLNSLSAKGRPGWTNIKNQPLAIRRPGAGIGKLMMAGSKGDLFHVWINSEACMALQSS
jgi:hypothetical protein